jgi:hypothetical protein
MGLNDAALNKMLDHLTNVTDGIDYISLHTDVIGSGNTNEVSGGTPAYARKGITWSAASSGNVDSSNQPQFDVPGSTTITRIGFQTALTGGTYYGDAEITDEAYGGQGTYTLTDCDISLT